MNCSFRRGAGFTIIELSLVLVVLGILAAALAPMAQLIHGDTMNKRDQATLDSAKNALLGYIRINQAIPCVDATGNDVSTGCDPATSLARLGVRTNDARRQTFAYDVNERLTEKWLDDNASDICTQLGYLIDPTTIPPAPAVPPPVEPQVCDAANANTGSSACTPTTTPSFPYSSTMSFVLVGRGSDRCLNLENAHASATNDAVCPTAVADNRTFENPVRLHSGTDDAGYYDDLIVTFTPAELAEELGCAAGGGGSGGFAWCPSGEKLVQVTNGYNAGTLAVVVNDGATTTCYEVLGGTTSGAGCQPETTTLSVYNGCGGSGTGSGTLYLSGALSALDSNSGGDGRVDIQCDHTPSCTAN